MTTLALKYRPSLLSDLVGQEASVKALTNALLRAKANGGAIHHQAFLFAGVRGTGKTSTARILARALNCKEGPTPTPCGVCDACLAAELPDQNLDIMEIDAASRSSVEDARALREQVQTRPAFCRYRIYIIDEVHMLSRSAFDALLKILEEPPAHAVFVLATTELQDVPDTIKSRVQIYPFRLIPVPIIEGRLKQVCEQEQVTWDEGSLRLLAEAGQGSMRDALTTLDRVIAAGDGHVAEDLVREQLGIVPAVSIQAILEALLQGDTVAILDHCAALASLGSDWVSFWRELMLAFQVRMEADLRRGAAPHETLRWARMLQLMLQRERDLRDSSLPGVVVELALITAAQLPHLAPLDALLKAGPAAVAARGSAAPSASASAASLRPAASSPRPFAPSPAPGPDRSARPAATAVSGGPSATAAPAPYRSPASAPSSAPSPAVASSSPSDRSFGSSMAASPDRASAPAPASAQTSALVSAPASALAAANASAPASALAAADSPVSASAMASAPVYASAPASAPALATPPERSFDSSAVGLPGRSATAPASGRPELADYAAAPSAAPEPRAERPVLRPLEHPEDQELLKRACTEALKQATGGLPRTLGSLPYMATRLQLRGETLYWLFPPNVRNTVQDLEREQANPHLLGALRQVLPGLARLEIRFEAEDKPGPEAMLRADPEFQRLMSDTGGQIVDIRQPE